jgi:hypothetical protein
MHEGQPIAERHSDVIHEFQRRRPGAAFLAIHHDQIGGDPGLQQGLDDGDEFPRMADTQLEADRLAI